MKMPAFPDNLRGDRRSGRTFLRLLAIGLMWAIPTRLPAALPTGFSERVISGPSGGWHEAVGVTFEATGRMYVWERGGRVWFKDPTDPTFTVLLDIREEVMPFLDQGMLGFALDPAFRQNGRFYVCYAVDRHYLLYYGTPSYDAATTLAQVATIQRVTRYMARASDGFRSVDPASRLILIGETKTTGIPLFSDTHSGGCLVFGADGTLLVSTGDGASPYGTDAGGAAPSGYAVQGLADAMIRPAEDVGAYRAQLLNSHSGKILRINPENGDGLPSNPYYDASNPRSPQSRVFALGLRNPFRMILRPGTGSHLIEDANPGVLYIGDVGWDTWEELNVMTGPRQNFGWPLFEGTGLASSGSNSFNKAVQNRDTPNPLYPGAGSPYFNFSDLLKQDTLAASGLPPFPNPTDPTVKIPSTVPQFLQRRPALDWNHNNAITRSPSYGPNGEAQVVNVGTAGSPVTGDQFQGNCSVGGVWYTGTTFPATYQNTLFHADWGRGLIKNLVFDANHNPTALRDFLTGGGFVTSIAQHPIDGSLYYVNFDYNASTVRQITYGANQPPVAVATADKLFGAEPLTVQFSGAGSSDPDGNPLTYSWNFGDGSPIATGSSAVHTFPSPGGVPVGYTVTLTVTDSGSLSSQTTLRVAANDTPPTVTILSPIDGAYYDPLVTTTVNLNALVTDGQSPDSQLLYQWQTILHHNEHNHANPVDTQHTTTTVLSPTGAPDGVNRFYYRIVLTVTDPLGLTASDEVRLYPTPGTINTAPTITAIPDQSVTVGTSLAPLALVVGDAETAVGSLTLSGTSSNVTLVPVSALVFGGSGANRTLTITPVAGQTGHATITAAVSDGTTSTSTTFKLTVNPLVVGGLVAAYSFNEGAGLTATDFSGNSNTATLNGATWSALGKNGGALAFNGSSSVAVINASPSLNLTGAMTLEAWVYPSAAQSGWRTIIQREVDAYFLHASSNTALAPAAGGTFGGTVAFTNSPSALPLNVWSHLAVTYDGASVRLFVNGVMASSKAQTGAIQSSTAALRIGGNVPYGEYFLGRIDDVRVYNRALSTTELQTDMLNPVSTPGAAPTISTVANQTTPVNTAVGPLDFTIGDTDTPLSGLTLTASSSNLTLVPNANLVLGGTGSARTLLITPATNKSGTALITLTVTDGQTNTPSAFTLTVTPPPPTITSPLTASGNAGTAFTYTITASNSPTSFQATGLPSALTVNPTTGVITGIPAAAGTSTVILSATNVSGSGSATLTLTINPTLPTNTAPTITTIANQTVVVGTTTIGPLAFTVGDAETAAGNLTVSGTSSNLTLLPAANLSLGGIGSARTITITPATGQTGTATVTLTVFDGALTAKTTFTITVIPPAGTGLVAAYNFNAGSGTSVVDRSGYGNTGSITGATWTSLGKYGSALNFSGTGNLVVISPSASLNLSTGMTIEAWVYPSATQSGWRTIVQREVDAYLLHASSNAALRPAGGGTFGSTLAIASSASAIPVNTWTHLAVTYDQTTIRLFVNGVQSASRARTGALQSVSTPVRIGGNVPYGEYFQGRIDEVRIYNRALTTAEILSDSLTAIP